MSSQSEPAPTVSRILKTREHVVGASGIAEFAVPRNAKVRSKELPDGSKICYLRYEYSLVNGTVHAHVRCDEPSKHLGLRITARFELWHRCFACGREDLALDLYPVPDKHATHDVCVIVGSNLPKKVRRRPRRLIEAPKPMIGYVVIMRKQSEA